MYFHFMSQEYIYENDTGNKIWGLMTETQRQEFPFNVKLI